MILRNARFVIILLFAAMGAVTFGLLAPQMLQALYSWISALTSPASALRESERFSGNYPHANHPAGIAAMTLLGMMAGGSVGAIAHRTVDHVFRGWDRMQSGDKVTLFLGIFAGIVASLPFLFLFQPLGGFVAPVGALALTIGFSAVSVYALRSMSEVLPWHQHNGGSRKSGVKILDTNVLIDGRIYDVARTGFLEGEFYVPNFVIDELQYIADSPDPLRRQRGRRGLDVLRHLQSDYQVEVGNQDKLAGDSKDEVDIRLVRLARALGGDIVTNDFNLNRVATVHKVSVLNLNDLALALKPNVLPKESLTVTIIREGNQAGQGVGYLDDGTMVVVEGGKRHLNETTPVIVTQVIQTERGKMIFAEVEGDLDAEARRRRPPLR